MSQAGITRADKAKFLEANGWTFVREPHKAKYWIDPMGLTTFLDTESAYELCERRLKHYVDTKRSP